MREILWGLLGLVVAMKEAAFALCRLLLMLAGFYILLIPEVELPVAFMRGYHDVTVWLGMVWLACVTLTWFSLLVVKFNEVLPRG